MFCVACGLKMSDDMAVCPGCGKERAVREPFSKLSDHPAAQSSKPSDDPAVQSNKLSDDSIVQPGKRSDNRGDTRPVPLFPTTDYGPAVRPFSMVPPSSSSYNNENFDGGAGLPFYPPGPLPPVSPVPPLPFVSPLPPPYMFPPPVQPAKRKNNRLFYIIGGVLLVFFILCGTLVYLEVSIISIGMRQITMRATPTALSERSTYVANAGPDQNPYPPQTGTLVMSDPMHDNSKGYNWDEVTMTTSNASCGYKLGSYHVTRSKGGTMICDPESAQMILSNLTFEAQVTIIQGRMIGLVVRFDQVKGVGYLVTITTSGSYGIYSLDFNNSDPNKRYVVLTQGSSSAIRSGLNQSNLLAIVANGSSLSFFVNHQLVDSVQNASFTNGQIGIYGYGSPYEDIVAQDARVWRL